MISVYIVDTWQKLFVFDYCIFNCIHLIVPGTLKHKVLGRLQEPQGSNIKDEMNVRCLPLILLVCSGSLFKGKGEKREREVVCGQVW